MRMLDLISDQFAYEKGITNAASPITEILAHRKGVCQDFTHLMIGCARLLGIPARYVSGLIHPDAQKYRGYTQTHAWCELRFPSLGEWVGFDATNHCVVGGNFVKVAVGRDFRDVAPNKGLYRGGAREAIDVAVVSEELKSIPTELAAERVQGLSLTAPQPAGAGNTSVAIESGGMTPREIMEQQQQQQQ
jgi:transglutaminase-like putative cysteine protease